jgi:hypothetical protein
MSVEGIYAVQYRDNNGRIYVNIYAVDSEYGADEINDYNLDLAIQKSNPIDYDYYSISDLSYDGEELIYEQLSEDFKAKKIAQLERKIEENKNEISMLENQPRDYNNPDADKDAMMNSYRYEYAKRQLKMDEKMLEAVRNDMW